MLPMGRQTTLLRCDTTVLLEVYGRLTKASLQILNVLIQALLQ